MEKQIEEMANFLWHNTLIHTEDLCHDVAETLVKAGYRKASEDAMEIFAEVEKAFGGAHRLWLRSCPGEYEAYVELKKKYTEVGNENT